MTHRRNISIYIKLNGRRATKGGYPVKLCVYYYAGGKDLTSTRSLGYYLTEKQWEATQKDRPKGEALKLKRRFDTIVEQAWEIADRINPFTFAAFWREWEGKKGPEETLQYWIDQKKAQVGEGTQKMYVQLESFISRMSKRNNFLLVDITAETLRRWQKQYDGEGYRVYYRHLKAVYKLAVKSKAIKESPFDAYDMPKRTETKKKGEELTLPQLRKLFAYEPQNAGEAEALNLFRLSYYTGGHDMSTLAHLRYEDLRGDVLTVKRTKTSKTVYIPVTDEVRAILDGYEQPEYLLPILGEDPAKHRTEVRNATSRVNKHLKRIAEKAHLPAITMYWARHTAAAVLIRAKVDQALIDSVTGNTKAVRDKHYTPEMKEEQLQALSLLSDFGQGERAPEE